MNRMLEGKSGVMDAEAQQRLTYIAKQISELKESLDDYFVASIPGKDCLKETVDLYQNIIAPPLSSLCRRSEIWDNVPKQKACKENFLQAFIIASIRFYFSIILISPSGVSSN